MRHLTHKTGEGHVLLWLRFMLGEHHICSHCCHMVTTSADCLPSIHGSCPQQNHHQSYLDRKSNGSGSQRPWVHHNAHTRPPNDARCVSKLQVSHTGRNITVTLSRSTGQHLKCQVNWWVCPATRCAPASLPRPVDATQSSQKTWSWHALW